MAHDDPVGRPAKGPEKFDLSTVTPDDFETLAYLLAHAEDGDVVIVRNKDRGLDARLPNPSGGVTLRGWQAKRFTDGLHSKQCQSSLDVAVAFWRPLRVTFVFAQDLSASEQTTFQNEVVVRHPEVRVDFWSEIEVQRRLRDSEEGRRAAGWLFGSGNTMEDVLAAMVSKAPVRTPTEIAERQAALQEKLDRDPQFFYTTVARPKGGPFTPPGPETALSVLLDIGGQEVRYDLAERYPGAAEDLGEPMLVFADDEGGQEARRTLEAARDASGPIQISSGVGLHWPRIPVGLRGLVPEEPTFGPATLTPADDASDLAEPSTFAALAAAGDIRLGMVFGQLDEPTSGWDATMGATAGGLELLYSIRHDDDGVMHHRVDWRHTLGQGQALDQLLSTRLLAAVLDGAEFTLSVSDQPEARMTGSADTEYGPSDVEQLRAHEAYLQLACEVQAWIGQPIEPSVRPTQADVDELRRAVSLIRQPQRRGTWREVNVVVTDQDEAPERFEAVVLETVHIELFGERHYLGIDLIALGPCRLGPNGDKLLPADGGGEVLITLQHPEKAPAEAAAPPGATGAGRLIIRDRATTDNDEAPEP